MVADPSSRLKGLREKRKKRPLFAMSGACCPVVRVNGQLIYNDFYRVMTYSSS
jgi:hypothetical protein